MPLPAISATVPASAVGHRNAPAKQRKAKLASCLSCLPCFTPKRVITVNNTTTTPVIAIINEDPERLRCVGVSAGGTGGGDQAPIAVKASAVWETSGSAPSQKIAIAPGRESEVRVKSAVVYATLCVAAEQGMWRVVMDNRMLDDFSSLNIRTYHIEESATLNTVGSLP